MAKSLNAGITRRIMNPQKGVPLAGYVRMKGNQGIHDDLTATALVLDDGMTRLALVALDLEYIHESMVDRIRERSAPIEVVLCCSHTHSGPVVYATKKATPETRAYLESLVENIIAAVQEAGKKTVPVLVEYSSGQGDIAINRRQRFPDGKYRTGENPDGPVDRSVQVISIMTMNAERIATVINYACHATVFGPPNYLASADWVWVMRIRVEKELGGLAMFLQGAAGNINPKGSFPFSKKNDEQTRNLVVSHGNSMADSVLNAVHTHSEKLNGTPLRIMRQVAWLPSEVPATTAIPPVNYKKGLLQALRLPSFLAFGVDFFIDKIFPWQFPRVEAKDGGEFVHPRHGRLTPYMGKQWLENVEVYYGIAQNMLQTNIVPQGLRVCGDPLP